MDDLIRMKGDGKPLLTLTTGRGRWSMVHFADGSWGLRQGDATIAAWEHDEFEGCFDAFAALLPTGVRDVGLVVFRGAEEEASGGTSAMRSLN